MSTKKNTRGGFLIWAGTILIVVAAIADIAVLFTDNYTRNMLLTVPVWILGILCFALAGKNSKNKR